MSVKTPVLDWFSKLGIQIRDTDHGFILKKPLLPPFEVFTTPGTLPEKVLSLGRDHRKGRKRDGGNGKIIRWGNFLSLRDQIRLNQWRERNTSLRNPAVLFIKYSYILDY